MKCPSCKEPLRRVKYEDVNVDSCSQCHGTLVRFAKLKSIESRRQKSKDDLMNEMIQADGIDTQQNLRCPRCLSRMEKRSKKIGNSRFSIDRCTKCELMWLDAGELAKLQIIHEYSVKGREQQAFRERLENMTPEEKKELDDRIASLPWTITDTDDHDFDWFDTWGMFD